MARMVEIKVSNVVNDKSDTDDEEELMESGQVVLSIVESIMLNRHWGTLESHGLQSLHTL